MSWIALLPIAGVLALIAYAMVVENERLSGAAQRYRELEHEGLDELLEARDGMPEFRRSRRTIILPDGTEADERTILREELAHLRRYQREREAEKRARRGVTRSSARGSPG